MAAAAKTRKRKRQDKVPGQRTRPMFMPYDKDKREPLVQPPAELAHLEGDELFEALTEADKFREVTGHEPAKWYSERFWTEVGRSEGRFKVWMGYHYKVKRGVDPATIEDRIMVEPDGYDRRSPWWYETTARKWANAEGIMTRAGKFEPYKPPGRPAGATDSKPRNRKATMRAGALEVLREVEALTAAGTALAEAKVAVGARHKLTTTQIARRLTAGRKMRAAGVKPLTLDMSERERGEIIVTMYRLLMADGRRKLGDNARAEVADRLGCDIDEVNRAIDGAPPAVMAAPDPHVMTRGEAKDIVGALFRDDT